MPTDAAGRRPLLTAVGTAVVVGIFFLLFGFGSTPASGNLVPAPWDKGVHLAVFATLVGLLGGLIGIGVSALGVALMTTLGIGETIPIPREATPVAVALVVASVVIAWASTFLSARVAVGERVANVLRYE